MAVIFVALTLVVVVPCVGEGSHADLDERDAAERKLVISAPYAGRMFTLRRELEDH